MADTDVVIANLALGHLGNSKGIASLDERSAPARACQQFYAQTIDEVLREFPWPFAGAFVLLQVVAAAPTTEWAFAYQYPVEALALRRLLSPVTRNDSRASRVPFRRVGQLIFTDLEGATGEFTVRVDEASYYPPDFVQCAALKLAAWIAPQVTAGDPAKLSSRALGLYQQQLEVAAVNAALEERPDIEPDSSFITCRD